MNTCLACALALHLVGTAPAPAAPTAAPDRAAEAATGADGVALTTIDGRRVHLSDAPFRDHVLLVVNTASQCGYTPQYAGLQALQQKYRDRGLWVLGFPSNDFGGQEPGTNAEIKQFCQSKYQVDFPLFEKGPVSGAAAQPLYRWLLANSNDREPINWNFEKFLLSRQHRVVARFRSKSTPQSPELVSSIEAALRAL